MDTNLSQDTKTAAVSFGQRVRKCLFFLFIIGAVFFAIPGLNPVFAKASPKLNKTKISLAEGKKYKLKLKKNKKKVKWSSSRKKVASVSKKGVVTAKKAGTAIIKAKAGKKTYKCKVTVKKAEKKTAKKASIKPYIVESCWKSYTEEGLGGELSVVVSVCNPTDRVLYIPCVSVNGYDSAGKLLTKYTKINISYISPHDTVTRSFVCSTGDGVVDKVDLRLENGMDSTDNFYYVDPDSSKYTTTGKMSVTNLKMNKEPSGSWLFTGTLVNKTGFADLRGTVSLIFYKNGKIVFGGHETYFNLKYAPGNEVNIQMSSSEYQQIDPTWEYKMIAFPTGRSE